MSLGFWMRKYTLRRYKSPEAMDGYSFAEYFDTEIMADVQTLDKTTATGEDGDDTLQRLKVFCNEEIRTADGKTGLLADRIWFHGKWFECRSSRLSDNTMLRHWTSTFVQCVNQDAPPKRRNRVDDQRN